jgi:biotin-dependent carboxylase-like uncharacterized protein
MSVEVFKVLRVGLGATLQDQGRRGWRRFGVPSSGAMDAHAAGWANRLLDNPTDVPVIELLLQGAEFLVLQDAWITVTGAHAEANIPTWRTVQVKAGDKLQFPKNCWGVWIYIAVEGGFVGDNILGSASVYPRGRLGTALSPGDIIKKISDAHYALPPGIAGRVVAPDERRDYDSPPPLRVWPGPQMNAFAETDRLLFFGSEWTVASQSDRVGYRLSGPTLKVSSPQIISEPVRVGSVQVPENGQPIVTMRDGPTVGGYPKLGMIDPADLSWLAQCRPGRPVRFQLIDERRTCF